METRGKWCLEPIALPKNINDRQADNEREPHGEIERLGMSLQGYIYVHPVKTGHHGRQTDHNGDGGQEFHHTIKIIRNEE